jgi:hypothetical protein
VFRPYSLPIVRERFAVTVNSQSRPCAFHELSVASVDASSRGDHFRDQRAIVLDIVQSWKVNHGKE